MPCVSFKNNCYRKCKWKKILINNKDDLQSNLDGVQNTPDSEEGDLLPIYRLCCAMLFRAYEDIEHNPDSPYNALFADSANSWLFNDAHKAAIPFGFVCTLLGISKEEARQKAQCIKDGELSVRQLSPLKPSVKEI